MEQVESIWTRGAARRFPIPKRAISPKWNNSVSSRNASGGHPVHGKRKKASVFIGTRVKHRIFRHVPPKRDSTDMV